MKSLLGIYSKKIYARKCSIKTVDSSVAQKFLDENHIQGKLPSKIYLGLYYENELIMVMTFGKARFSKKVKYTWELLRLCSKAGYNVIGGASKLFKYFIENYCNSGDSIVSFSTYSKGKGTVYTKLGFTFDHLSKPGYIWYKSPNNILSRYQCQMKNEESEMHNKGYVRIYDSGNKTWVYNIK